MTTKFLTTSDEIRVGNLLIYTNGEEVFVQNKVGCLSAHTKIRVSAAGENLLITAAGNRLSPTSVHSLDAIRVTNY